MTSGGGHEFRCAKCGCYSQSIHDPLCPACWMEHRVFELEAKLATETLHRKAAEEYSERHRLRAELAMECATRMVEEALRMAVEGTAEEKLLEEREKYKGNAERLREVISAMLAHVEGRVFALGMGDCEPADEGKALDNARAALAQPEQVGGVI